jgi:very-short-patch-repair endonuclease
MACCRAKQPCRIISGVIRRQVGVIGLDQARRHGWSAGEVRNLVESRRWQRIHPGVYATTTGALSYMERVWAAVLAVGGDVAASHETAVWLIDPADRPPPAKVHLLTTHSRVLRLAATDVIVHRTRHIPPEHIHVAARPRRVTVERAVADAAGAAPSEDEAISIVARAIQRGLTTPCRLNRTLDDLPRLPRRALLREALALAGSGAHSAAEVRFVRRASRHNLPAFTLQVRDVIGGAICLDALLVTPSGRELVVELDGRLGHFDAASWRRDMLRDSTQAASGRIVLRLPALLTFTDIGQIFGLVAAALRREGWTGTLRCSTPRCTCRAVFKAVMSRSA